jgi:hypothetical protein
MELVFPDGEARERVNEDRTLDPGCKFAMFRTGKTYVTVLFPRSLIHADVAGAYASSHPDLQFTGAGFVFGNVPRWGSESCVERYGDDRPTGAALKTLLDELASALIAA